MTANLANLTSGNIELIQEIVAIGLDMGMDRTVINAALNIANAESSFRKDAKAPTSTAWGPFQYLDGSWPTGWNRLVRDQHRVGLTVDGSLSADSTRDSAMWQIRVAFNEFRNYYDGYPQIIHRAWKPKVAALVDRGFYPDTNFLQYAYLRHNTDGEPGGQVETVYKRDFTHTTVSKVNALGSATQMVLLLLPNNHDLKISGMDLGIHGDDDLVEMTYSGGTNVLTKNGASPSKIQVVPADKRITASYPDGSTQTFSTP